MPTILYIISLVDLKNRYAAWKTSFESHGFRVNVNKTKILVSSAEHIKISDPKYPCGFCTFGQCGGCSDTVSARIVSSWKALRELLPILTNYAIRTKPRGNVFNICVRKMLLYGSGTWPVVTEDV